MIGSRIPRFVFYVTTLGVIVAAIMLSMFYGQYRWLANQIVSTSYDEHRTLLEGSFERRMRAELHAIADLLPGTPDAEPNAVLNTLSRAMTADPDLNGLRFTSLSGESWSSGNYPQAPYVSETTWLDEQVLITYPVLRDEQEVGHISGSFQLGTLRSDLASFTDQLQTKEDESRRVSYLWIGGGTTAVLLLCGAVVWLLVRGQTKRIRELKAQAERFRNADFGEPLPAGRGDDC